MKKSDKLIIEILKKNQSNLKDKVVINKDYSGKNYITQRKNGNWECICKQYLLYGNCNHINGSRMDELL